MGTGSRPRTSTGSWWSFLRRNNPRAFEAGRGKCIGLRLTTTGRKSGLPRKPPLQYERLDDEIYIGSARGEQADWYRNVVANPQVTLTIGAETFAALADPLRGPDEIQAFLRLRRHPLMIRMLLMIHGLPPWAGERELRRLAERLAVVALRNLHRVSPSAPPSPTGSTHA